VRRILRRHAAAAYLEQHHGYHCRAQMLAKLATDGGSPPMHYRNNIPYYFTDELDAWVETAFSPAVTSTSALPRAVKRGRPPRGKTIPTPAPLPARRAKPTKAGAPEVPTATA
jgi:hypothetical protein